VKASRRRLVLIGAGGLLLGVAVPAPAAKSQSRAVVAVVAESGVDVLQPEFRTTDGRDAELPAAIRGRVVRVALPPGDRDAKAAALKRGPLGHPVVGTLYYVSGTRLLLYFGQREAGVPAAPPWVGADHGTGTASVAGGRTVGAAPNALVVVLISYQEPAWAWLAEQSWIDVSSSSTFELPTALLCDSYTGMRTFRQLGHLPFVAAGNGFFDSTVLSPGNSPDAVRVGGVLPDGSSFLPGADASDPLFWSGRAYDTAGAMTMRIAKAGTDGLVTASGTSGSSPMVAGRVAHVLSTVRRAVGDTGSGVRAGALVIAQRAPRVGPLADGRLDAEELLEVVLAASRPKGTAAPGRYAIEGYGWFNLEAAKDAVAILLGQRTLPSRLEDDLAYDTAIQARAGLATAKLCQRAK